MTTNSYAQYQAHLERVDGLIKREANLPEQVFKEQFNSFLFIDFDKLFTEQFHEGLCRWQRERDAWHHYLMVLSPDPMEFYFGRYLYYPILKVETGCSYEDFANGVIAYAGEESKGAICYRSELLLFYDESAKWAIYCDKGYELAIAAFSSAGEKEAFAAAMGEINCYRAVDYMEWMGKMRVATNREALTPAIERVFLENYGR